MIEAVVALAVVAGVLGSIGSLVAVTRAGTRTLEQHVALSEALRLVSATAQLAAGSEQSGYSSGFEWRIATLPFAEHDTIGSPSIWIPQRVVVQVRSPSGIVSSLETIRLTKRPPG